MTFRLSEELLGSTAAGVISTILGHPLDTLKVHMQTQSFSSPSQNHPNGLFRTAQTLVRRDPLALWRGLLPPLGNAILMNAVMFSAFASVKEVKESNTDGDVNVKNHSSQNHDTTRNSLWAGLFSGFCLAFLSTPVDYLKIQAQLRMNRSNTPTIWEIVRQTFGTKGGTPLFLLTTLYRGHTVNLGREGIFTMIFLGVYDAIQPQGMMQIAVTSSFTGAVAWVATYPLDTLKSVMQASSPNVNKSGEKHSGSIPRAIVEIYRRGGMSAFYRGCLSSTGRAILVTCSRMMAYETVLAWIR